MNKLGKTLNLILFSAIFIVFLCNFSFWVILPKVINTPKNITKYETFLSKKTGFDVKIDGLKFIPKINFSFDIKLKEIRAFSKEKEKLAQINGFNYHASVLNIKNGRLRSDYIFADINTLKKYLKTNEKSEFNMDFSFFPVTNIKKGKIIFTKDTYADIEYIKSQKHFGSGITTEVLARIINPYTKHPVTIGETGSIHYKRNFGFDNFSVKFGTSEIFLTGDFNNLKIKGETLPVKELKEGFLYFYKLKHPDKKNFIENFSNFTGTLDADLEIKKGKFSGKCITRNLGADFSTLKIPVFLPMTVFYFEDKTMKAQTKGTFGGEPVTTDVIINGIATKELDVKGNVESVFTNKIVQNYYPNVAIDGNTPAKVTYHTHDDGIVDVYYSLTIPKGSNLLSVWGNLNNTDKTRRIMMHTNKNGTPMTIKSFDYSVQNSNGFEKLLYGDGLIDKKNGTYTLYNLNVKSNGKVAVNYIRSFLRHYVKNGTFDADVKLDFIRKSAFGTMNLYDVSHADFLFLNNANLNLGAKEVTFKANGNFYSSPISAVAVADNSLINNKITVKNIDIHLNSFFLQKGKLQSIPRTFKTGRKVNIAHKKRPDICIEQARVAVDRIYSNKFDIRNASIQGNLRNNIANFIIPKAEYAKGLLSAKGIYNLKEHSSDIQFFASDIDSNEVATNLFKLDGQVEGEAFATLHLITKNKLNDLKAKATFAISDGYLPKLGTQEFTIKKNKPDAKKYSLSKISNIDFSNPKEYYSNLYGSFNLDNDNLKDAKIFAKSEYLGLYIEGDYNIDSEYGNVEIFGIRNKTHAKKIKIFKIPVNLIYRIVFRPEHTITQYDDKIKLIPQIKLGIADEISVFRIFVNGYVNKSDTIKATFKDLR